MRDFHICQMCQSRAGRGRWRAASIRNGARRGSAVVDIPLRRLAAFVREVRIGTEVRPAPGRRPVIELRSGIEPLHDPRVGTQSAKTGMEQRAANVQVERQRGFRLIQRAGCQFTE